MNRARKERARVEARRLLLIAAGLSCFLASATAWYGIALLQNFSDLTGARGGVFAGLSAAVVMTGAAALVAVAHEVTRLGSAREDRRLLLGALVLATSTSAAAALVFLSGGPRINPVGFWRIVMVALIVLAILRHRMFDGAIRFQRTAIATLTVFAGLGAALLAEGLVRLAGVSALVDPPAALVVGAVFAGTVTVPYLPASRRLARRAFRALVEPHDPSHAQQLEIYRAALEARAAAGAPVSADEPELVKLRGELHVERRDHDLLMLFVQRQRAAGAGPPSFAPGARILDGTLTVEREIGAGSSARVYEARDEAGRAVAVKVQAPLLQGPGADGARAVREAELLDSVRSANVLRVVEVADRPEAFYVVTERASGSLADKLAAAPDGRLAPDEALRIARGVFAGLAAAHQAGVVHRDVKPANVLLAPDGTALLADFDAAVDAGARHAFARGTPAWMAPEQFGGASVTPAADVYAAGALLFRMLAGRHYLALDGLNEDQMRVMVARAVPAMPESWPADVRAFLGRCLAKDAAVRFADASSALEALPARWAG